MFYLHLHIVLLTLSCKTINGRIDFSIAPLLMGAACLIGMGLTFAVIQFVGQAPGCDTPDVIYFWMVPLAPHNLLSLVSFWIFYVHLIPDYLRKGLGQWVYSRYIWGSRSPYQMMKSGLENLGGLFAGILCYFMLTRFSISAAGLLGSEFAGDPTQIGGLGVVVIGVVLALIYLFFSFSHPSSWRFRPWENFGRDPGLQIA